MTIYDAMFNYGRYDPALPAHQFRPETILADSRESLTDLAVCCPRGMSDFMGLKGKISWDICIYLL